MRPGHENLVAMGAVSTVADDAIKRKLQQCNGNGTLVKSETLWAVFVFRRAFLSYVLGRFLNVKLYRQKKLGMQAV